jgi:hypothetical protein
MTNEKKSETLPSLRITPTRARELREALEYYDLDRPTMALLVHDALIHHYKNGHALCLPMRFKKYDGKGPAHGCIPRKNK